MAWKRGLPRPKFFYESLSPSPNLWYTITKKPKKKFAAEKSLRVLKLLTVLSDSILFRFLINLVFFRYLRDTVLLMVFSDRVLFESSVICSSKGSLVIDSSFGLSVVFFRHAGTFLSKGAATFLKKTFTLNN